MQTHQLFPGQNPALVCLAQPKTGNYVYEFYEFYVKYESQAKVNVSFSPFLYGHRFDRSCEKPRDCFGKKVLDYLSSFL